MLALPRQKGREVLPRQHGDLVRVGARVRVGVQVSVSVRVRVQVRVRVRARVMASMLTASETSSVDLLVSTCLVTATWLGLGLGWG